MTKNSQSPYFSLFSQQTVLALGQYALRKSSFENTCLLAGFCWGPSVPGTGQDFTWFSWTKSTQILSLPLLLGTYTASARQRLLLGRVMPSLAMSLS